MKAGLLLAIGLLTACGGTAMPNAGDTTSGDSGSDDSGGDPTSGAADPTTPTTNDSPSSGSSAPDDDTTAAADDDDSTGGGFPPPITDECIDDVRAGLHVYECEGLSFDVQLPADCLQMACGLIVDVHGLTMSAQMQEANTKLRALGSERGYIVVQPNAPAGAIGPSWTPDVDDAKVFAFLMRVALAFHVDLDRIFFTGFSQGGAMSWRFACDHADVLAAVAPAAACSADGGGVLPDCSFAGADVPSQPLPILYMHGTTDALVSYGCAEPRRDAIVAAFGLGPEQVVAEGDGFRWTRHEGPDRGLLEFLSHDYAADSFILGGHCYPGSDDPGNAPGQLFSFRCEGDNGFVWGEAVIDFFDAHPKR